MEKKLIDPSFYPQLTIQDLREQYNIVLNSSVKSTNTKERLNAISFYLRTFYR